MLIITKREQKVGLAVTLGPGVSKAKVCPMQLLTLHLVCSPGDRKKNISRQRTTQSNERFIPQITLFCFSLSRNTKYL